MMQPTTLKAKIAARIAASPTQNTAEMSEVRRIVALPLIDALEPEEADEVGRQVILGDAWERGFRLFPPQAGGFLAYQRFSGGFFPIGVGWGKTLLTLLIAHHAATVQKIERSILLVPSQVYAQLWDRDIAWARRQVRLDGLAFHGLGNRDAKTRRVLARSGKKGCYILPYSCMSVKDTSELLDSIAPGLVISDEAHNLRHRTAARTKRWLEMVSQHKPKVVALSGTITGKSILDYWHLIKAALGERSPVPLSSQLAHEWSAIIDAGADPSATQAGPLKPLVRWAKSNFPSEAFSEDVPGFRKSYKLRLTTAPGVVASGDSEIGVSLIMANRAVEKHTEHAEWAALKKLIDKVVDEWTTPNGDEIEHAIHTYKWLYELTSGFYNELSWPDEETFAQRRGLTREKAIDVLERAKAHHAASQVYARELRGWLEVNARQGLDTPMLVGLDMSKHGAANVGPELYEAWLAMKAKDFAGRPERDSRAVRVCDYKVQHAVKWAQALPAGTGGIVWVHHQEVGAWVAEALREAGVDVLHCPAGETHNRAITDPENRNKIVVASITAHGTGKNLQHFQNQLILQWPRAATTAEQLLGRTHRNGQEADELVVDLCNTTDFDTIVFAATLNDALYIHQSTGSRQKLIYASYDPLPRIYSPEFLRQHGLENKMLTAEQRRMLREKFEPGKG